MIVTRKEWGARPPKKMSFDIQPEYGGVAIHHTGGKPNFIGGHSECHSAVRGIQNSHMSGEYDDIAYSFVACRHGYLFEGRGLGVRTGANGTKDANTHFYAILGLVGGQVVPGAPDLYDPITNSLLEAVRFGISLARSSGGAGGKIVGHKNLYNTACPGKLYQYVQNGWLEPGTPPAWPPEDGHDPGGAPAFSGVLLHYPPTMRHSSAATWQRRMQQRGWGITPDGHYGPQSRRVCLAFQQEKGLTVDGVVGPQTWYAAWNAPVTPGSFPDDLAKAPAWPGTLFTYPPFTRHAAVKTWQQQMRSRGWSLSADGVYGADSKKVCLAFQREKGLISDGIVGPATWQAAWLAPVT